jgi:pilus assembly protein Flp/PilA
MLYEPKEKGQALVEYALQIMLIALVVVAALLLFGEELANFYQYAVDQIASVMP